MRTTVVFPTGRPGEQKGSRVYEGCRVSVDPDTDELWIVDGSGGIIQTFTSSEWDRVAVEND